MHASLWGGEKQVLLECIICRQKSIFFFFFPSLNICGGNQSSFSELPKC